MVLPADAVAQLVDGRQVEVVHRQERERLVADVEGVGLGDLGEAVALGERLFDTGVQRQL